MKCTILSLSVFTFLSNYVSAHATNERYDPYPYLTLKSPLSGTLTSSNDTSTNNTSIDNTSVNATDPSTSSITIVAVEPPAATEDVEYIANVFYANWHKTSSNSSSLSPTGLKYSIEDIPWDYVGSVTYGFIPVPTANLTNITLTLEDASAIPQLVALGQRYNVSIILALGGHLKGGASSAGFASALQTPESIADFVTGVSSLVNQTSVGGIEFDWEVSSCLDGENPYVSSDVSASYLTFLQQLRKELGDDISISLAVGPVPLATPVVAGTGSDLAIRANVTDPDLKNSFSNDNTTTIANSTDVQVNSNLTLNATEVTTVIGDFKNVSDFARVVDWITILNYDLSGPWTSSSLVLPNSPLNATCSSNTTAVIDLPYSISATTSVASWTLSGFRADQIVLGVSASGRSYYVGTDLDLDSPDEGIYPTFLSSKINATAPANYTILGDEWWWGDVTVLPKTNTTLNTTLAGNETFTSTDATCDLSTLNEFSGVFTFRGLVNAGYLDTEGDVAGCDPDEEVAGDELEDTVEETEEEEDTISLWDECSETPFLYVKKTGVMVSYDDAESMELKGEFILNAGLRGFSLREVGGDSNNILLGAIRHGAGFPEDLACGPDEELVYEDVADTVEDGDGDENSWDWEDYLEGAW
ncbi:hypothetical protein FRC03_012439 [Tulasnella sp. 419]|nr:hypothetical protein FRC03_012439 [Tulasnella sp. 419]